MGEIFRQAHSPATLNEPAETRIARLHRAYVARSLAIGRAVLALDLEPESQALIGQRAGELLPQGEGVTADLVVAFGALARCSEPGPCLAALRHTVRPGGRLLLDAPVRGTAGALQALTPAGIEAALLAEFAHVRVFAARGLIGSVLLGAPATVATVFSHPDRLHAEMSHGLADLDGLVCVASDGPLDDVGDSLLIDAEIETLASVQARAREAETERDMLRIAHAALAEQTQQQRRTDAQWRHELAVLRVSAAAAASETRAMSAQRDAVVQTSMAMIARVQQLEQQSGARAAAAEAECARLRAVLETPPAPLISRVRRRAAALLPGIRGRSDAVGRSATFDAAWYLDRYADIRAAGLDPARHYLTNGAAEGREPGPGFDTAWYSQQHPELAGSGLTPVEFHDRYGVPAGWPTAPAPATATPVTARPANPRVLFISGEADTPGSQYRCVRYAQAARDAGWDAGWSRLEETGAVELIGVEIAVLWRVRYSAHVEGVMREVRQAGGTVVFDVDDLMIRPELAATRIIDGIRTTNAGIGSTRETFAQVQQAMMHADLCTTTTEELAQHMRAFQKATYILPNGFDAATLARSRRAVRARAQTAGDGLIRIGYAAGTVTHQKDFAAALNGIIQVLRARPRVRLVLFRAKDGPELVVVDEFDALAPYADRIEWRDKVELEGLPAELARFDINIAPLELGNPFCEAKSELKYFEAALVNVPTVASPSGPFARVITDGHNGMLAADDTAWHDALLRLADDAELRQVMGRQAYLDCIWPFGPRRRARLVHAFLEQLHGTEAGAQAFALDVLEQRAQRQRASHAMTIATASVLYRADRLGEAAVTVIVPCYNYAETIIEALESVRLQTLEPLDLVVVDDCSADPLATELIVEWARRHEARFNRLVVLRHTANAGLSAARNSGFNMAETEYVLPLDADNRLHPGCCATLLASLQSSSTAFAYGSVRMFGASDDVFCNERYQPVRLIGGNYIDAMALIGKWAWAAAGGYDMPRDMGWEDFDLWCRLAELGLRGIHVDQVLAEYRVHDLSMVSTMVEVAENKQRMVELIEQRHDWLRLSSRAPHERV